MVCLSTLRPFQGVLVHAHEALLWCLSTSSRQLYVHWVMLGHTLYMLVLFYASLCTYWAKRTHMQAMPGHELGLLRANLPPWWLLLRGEHACATIKTHSCISSPHALVQAKPFLRTLANMSAYHEACVKALLDAPTSAWALTHMCLQKAKTWHNRACPNV